MAKVSKLYALLLQSTDRTISFRDFIALMEAFGFLHQRTKGSHQSYAHPDCIGSMVVQPRGKDAKRYQVLQFLDMVEQNGLTLEK